MSSKARTNTATVLQSSEYTRIPRHSLPAKPRESKPSEGKPSNVSGRRAEAESSMHQASSTAATHKGSSRAAAAAQIPGYAQAYADGEQLTSAQKMVAMKDLDMDGFEVRAAPYMLPPPPPRPLPEVGRMSRPPPLVFLNIGVFAYKARVVQLLGSAVPSPKNHTPLRNAR